MVIALQYLIRWRLQCHDDCRTLMRAIVDRVVSIRPYTLALPNALMEFFVWGMTNDAPAFSLRLSSSPFLMTLLRKLSPTTQITMRLDAMTAIANGSGYDWEVAVRDGDGDQWLISVDHHYQHTDQWFIELNGVLRRTGPELTAEYRLEYF